MEGTWGLWLVKKGFCLFSGHPQLIPQMLRNELYYMKPPRFGIIISLTPASCDSTLFFPVSFSIQVEHRTQAMRKFMQQLWFSFSSLFPYRQETGCAERYRESRGMYQKTIECLFHKQWIITTITVIPLMAIIININLSSAGLEWHSVVQGPL